MNKELSKLLCKHITETKTEEERKAAVKELKRTIDAINEIQNVIKKYCYDDDEKIIDIEFDDYFDEVYIHLSNKITAPIINNIGSIFKDNNIIVTTKEGEKEILLITQNCNNRLCLHKTDI